MDVPEDSKASGGSVPEDSKASGGGGEMDVPEDSFKKKWQPRKDSNLNKMNQNHLCYHYTTGLHDDI